MPAKRSTLPAKRSAYPNKRSAFPKKLTPARIAQMRGLVEGTTRSFQRIGTEVGVSAATVSRYMHMEGWRRPPGSARPARIGSVRDRITEKLWKLTERHAEALAGQPVELTQRSLQPLARIARVLGDIDRHTEAFSPAPDPFAADPDPPSRSLNELRDELAAHLARIEEEEGAGWGEWDQWFRDGAGI